MGGEYLSSLSNWLVCYAHSVHAYNILYNDNILIYVRKRLYYIPSNISLWNVSAAFKFKVQLPLKGFRLTSKLLCE